LDEFSSNGDFFFLQNGEKWMLFEFFINPNFDQFFWCFYKIARFYIKLQTNVYDLKILM